MAPAYGGDSAALLNVAAGHRSHPVCEDEPDLIDLTRRTDEVPPPWAGDEPPDVIEDPDLLLSRPVYGDEPNGVDAKFLRRCSVPAYGGEPVGSYTSCVGSMSRPCVRG